MSWECTFVDHSGPQAVTSVEAIVNIPNIPSNSSPQELHFETLTKSIGGSCMKVWVFLKSGPCLAPLNAHTFIEYLHKVVDISNKINDY